MTKPQNAKIKADDIVLVNIDVYGDGKINTFDGHVLSVNQSGLMFYTCKVTTHVMIS